MKSIFFITMLLFLTAFFYLKRAVNSFKVSLYKVSSISINKNKIKGVVILEIKNDLLPKFLIKNIDLDIYLNDVFLTKVKNYRILKEGFIELSLDIDLKKTATIDNLILIVQGAKLTVYGSVLVKKEIIETSISVNEKIYL